MSALILNSNYTFNKNGSHLHLTKHSVIKNQSKIEGNSAEMDSKSQTFLGCHV